MLGKIAHIVIHCFSRVAILCFCAFFLTSCSTIYNLVSSIISIPFRILDTIL